MEVASLSSKIRSCRTSDVTLRLTRDAAPLVRVPVRVEQISHRMLFGSNWGDSAIAAANGELHGDALEQARQRNERFLSLFNFVTLPFYWAGFEPVPGQPETMRLLRTARWYRDHGCSIKGHPLCWHTLAPGWLSQRTNAEAKALLLQRIGREARDFAGLLDAWDVVNEGVIMPSFDKYDNAITRLCREHGAVDLIRDSFAAAKAADPSARLVLNDFDTSPAYAMLIERCLDAGVPIDAIGIQSHMHQGYWGVEETERVLERFARFGLPLQFTETTLVSGDLMPSHFVDLNDYRVNDWPSTPEGEQRQAEETILHYRTLIEHPSVSAITWWDLVDGGWLNAPGGLLRRDLTAKPAFERLEQLLREEYWLTETEIPTDDTGSLSFTGFLGDYRLAWADQCITFSLNDIGSRTLPIELNSKHTELTL